MGFNPNGILHHMFFAHALIWNENGNFSMFPIDSALKTTSGSHLPDFPYARGTPHETRCMMQHAVQVDPNGIQNHMYFNHCYAAVTGAQAMHASNG